ncbi:unnamed protein product, partial [Ixodes persulcatus]
ERFAAVRLQRPLAETKKVKTSKTTKNGSDVYFCFVCFCFCQFCFLTLCFQPLTVRLTCDSYGWALFGAVASVQAVFVFLVLHVAVLCAAVLPSVIIMELFVVFNAWERASAVKTTFIHAS